MATTTKPSALRERMEEIGDLTAFAGSTLRALPASRRYTAETLRQLGLMVRGSTVLIVLMIAFIGISATNYGYYFLKAAGAADYVGLVAGLGGPRLGVALVFGYAFAAKVGCGFVGEIGAMRVNEELDAYESEGVTARRYIVATRVLASMLYVPIITALALVGFTLASYAQAVLVIHAVSADTFFRYTWANQAIADQFFSFAVMEVMAICISVVSCYYGTHVRGGPAAVGAAVARSLVINLVMIHVILGLGDSIVYGTTLGLPIGG
jgi:phospholipid/cholesterol/gamma-HCH transport system permease protein